MTYPNPIAAAGIDVARKRLGTHIRSLGRHFQNNKVGRCAQRSWLLSQGVSRAGLEPTGRYQRNLRQFLHDAGLETVLANPLRSGRWAEALGRLAGNDRADAAMLARFGLLAGLEALRPRAGNLQWLSNLPTATPPPFSALPPATATRGSAAAARTSSAGGASPAQALEADA